MQGTYNGWPLYLYVADARYSAISQAEDLGSRNLISPGGTVDVPPADSA